jgi:hypothetical protein
MAFVLKDRVKETSTTTGTGTITLGGASPGYQGFSTIGNANTTFYSIVMGTEWENGVGTYTSSGSALSRDTVLSSSNSGSLVNFSAGTKDVFINYPAGRAAAYDTPSQSTGAFHVTVGTTAQRPSSPSIGMIRYNTTESQYEVYNGSDWKYFAQANYPYSVSYLVVAGGGGGGFGGGGAGGFRTDSGFTLTPGTSYTVTVGAGGNGGASSTSGSNSVFSSITSAGGGVGGGATNNTDAGSNGGSGGGGGHGLGTSGGLVSPGNGGSGNTPSTSPSQGNNGGIGRENPNFAGGGGGGANAAGADSPSNGVGGNGGNGTASSISGSSVTYAGGGGGAYASSGGSGGGGNGGADASSNATSATANTGGGGGGANVFAALRGAGGSGIVIISYAGAQRGTGGTVTSSGGNTIHTFTSSGTYTA